MTAIDDTLHGTPEPALPGWKLGARSLLPIVQGGMGVGISAHRLAGTVAGLGAVGTISSVDLRHHHPDLLGARRAAPTRTRLDKLNLDRARPRSPHGARTGRRPRRDRGQRDEGSVRVSGVRAPERAKAARTRS